MTAVQATVADWIQIIQGEFQEIAGLHLTKSQAQRLWDLDAPTCDALLDGLVAVCFLRRTPDGEYVRALPVTMPE